MAKGLLSLGVGFSFDQVECCLSFQQIKFALQHGAAGKFSRFCWSSAKCVDGLCHRLEHGSSTMKVKFRTIFPSVTARCRKPQHECVVEGLATCVAQSPE